MTLVRSAHVLLDPRRDVDDLGEVVPRERLARVQRRERHAEPDVIHIRVRNQLVTSTTSHDGRVREQREQDATRVAPALGEALRKRLGVAERLGERDDGGLAVDGARELLGLVEDEGRVDRGEGGGVDGVGLLDEVVDAVAGLEAGADEMEEAREAQLEGVGGGLELGVDELEDGGEVLVQDGPAEDIRQCTYMRVR